MFYGWWIVSASVVIALYTGGVVYYGFTALFEPIANEMGWSYTQVSLAASLRNMEADLLAPVIGILADRWGPKRLILSGAVLTAIGLMLVGRTASLGMFYGAFALIALGMSACATTVLMTVITNWFRKKVGVASGIAVSGYGLSGLMVLLMVKLVEVYQWRMTLNILALGTLVTVIPLAFIFRHKPEQYGHLPDGQVESPGTLDKSRRLLLADEVEMKPKQALKSGTFWSLALAYMYHTLATSAVITHVMPYLSSISITRAMSGMVATAIPLSSIVGRLGFGWLGDKLDKRWVAAGTFALTGLGLLCFGYVSTAGIWMLAPFLILFGIGYGGNNALRPPLGREHFGRANFGTIFGLMTSINALGGITGATMAGWVFDTRGSYQSIWFGLAGLAVAVVISFLTMSPPKTK